MGKVVIELASEVYLLREINSCLKIRSIKHPVSSLSEVFKKYLKLKFKGQAKYSFSIQLNLENDGIMKKINRQQRGKNKTTDVLSFPYWSQFRKLKTSEFQEMHELGQINPQIPLGDIVISLDVLLKQANDFQIRPLDEFYHLMVHGFLHLLGFDHELGQKEEKLMEREEQYLLKMLELKLKR
jgi:probable rRNA maturation factor